MQTLPSCAHMRYDKCIMQKTFSAQTVISWLVVLALGLVPIFFLPLTADYYDTSKWFLLTLSAVIILAVGGISLFSRKTARIPFPTAVWGFGALTLVSLISVLVASPNKVEAIMAPIGPATFAALTILVAAGAAVRPTLRGRLAWVLYSSAAILGLIALYQFLGIGTIMFPSVGFLQDRLWTPTGSPMTTLALLVITFSLAASDIVTRAKTSEEHHLLALKILFAIVMAAGAAVTVWQIIPKMGMLLPLSAGWTVTLEMLKNVKAAIVGVGAENFVSAYTRGRPLWLNGGPLWGARFTTNANFFLHVTTINGLLGFAASLVFARSLFTGKRTGAWRTTTLLCLAALLLVPPTIALVTLIAAVFVLSTDHDQNTPTLSVSEPWVRLVAGVFLLLGVLGFYGLTRGYGAELSYFKALRAAQNNEGTQTYNFHIKAIQTNPFVSRYHMTYSQMNVALANTLAAQLGSEATEGSPSAKAEEDQKLVAGLIEQAIREAKIAVNLNMQNVSAWENLARIYQALIPAAKGADAWAAAAYEQTLQLDPFNANVAVSLGGVYVQQAKYDEAIQIFGRAIAMRPTYENAYYNLANAYRLKGDTVRAAEALNKTLTLIPEGSADYAKAKNELDALKNAPARPAPTPSEASGSSELTLPE